MLNVHTYDNTFFAESILSLHLGKNRFASEPFSFFPDTTGIPVKNELKKTKQELLDKPFFIFVDANTATGISYYSTLSVDTLYNSNQGIPALLKYLGKQR